MIQSCLFDDDYIDELYGFKKADNKSKNIVHDDNFLKALRKALENKEISYFKYLNMRREYIND